MKSNLPEVPLQTASIVPGTLQPATSRFIRRVGRPRKEWVPSVLQEAHRRNTSTLYLYDLAHNEKVWHKAFTLPTNYT